MKRLFALDQNFPVPIVEALAKYMPEAELVPISRIDREMPKLDDWQVLLALHCDERPWDGLITADSSILSLPRELSVLMQTKLALVVAEAAGPDPLKATGLVLAHLPTICKQRHPTEAQVWSLHATHRPSQKPWEALTRLAKRQKTEARELYDNHKLSTDELARSPLRR